MENIYIKNKSYFKHNKKQNIEIFSQAYQKNKNKASY